MMRTLSRMSTASSAVTVLALAVVCFFGNWKSQTDAADSPAPRRIRISIAFANFVHVRIVAWAPGAGSPCYRRRDGPPRPSYQPRRYKPECRCRKTRDE